MKRIRTNFYFGLTAIVIVGLTLLFTTPAAAAIGKISSFTGEVVLTSGERIEQVKSPGVPLNDGDIIQTKQGDAQVLFNDGSVLRISPFSNSLLQERDEQSGTWLFKTTTAARRVTCLVGKIFFESGASGKKNYLQTPMAVAGIRGSSGDFGFDNTNSYINMYTGEAAVTGTMIRGSFTNPGIEAARRSPVYQAQTRALSLKAETERVNTQTTSEGQKKVNSAAASVTVLNVATEAATLLAQRNPDPVVKEQAQMTAAVVKTSIAVVEATASVAKIQIVVEQATQTAQRARAAGDTVKAEAAQVAVAEVQQRVATAQLAVETAQKVATTTSQSAAAGTLTQAQADRNANMVTAIATVTNNMANVDRAETSLRVVAADAANAEKQAAATRNTTEIRQTSATLVVAEQAVTNTNTACDSVAKQLEVVTQAAQAGDLAKAQQAAQTSTTVAQTATAVAQAVTAAVGANSTNVAAIQSGIRDTASTQTAAATANQAAQQAVQQQAVVTQAAATGNITQMNQAASAAQQSANISTQAQAQVQAQVQTQAQTQNITTTVLTTIAPTTTVITTVEPTTAAPTTIPATVAPTTVAPTTVAPTTVGPTTTPTTVPTTIPTTVSTTVQPTTTTSSSTTTSVTPSK